MEAKPYEKREARRLRARGVPMKRIAALLGVSPGSVHLWTSDITITDAQLSENRRRGAKVRSVAWAERFREVRRGYQDEGRRRAREGDPLHQAGCMLYWAEGTKSRNTVGVSNSDVNLLRFFGQFLRTSFDVKPEDFKVSVNVYLNNGLAIDEIERYWLDALGLPPSCLRKHIIDFKPTSSSGLKRNKLPYGVCQLRVGSSTRIVQHIYGAIQEYADFEEPRWLDGAPRAASTPLRG
jgi:hypothetical protein